MVVPSAGAPSPVMRDNAGKRVITQLSGLVDGGITAFRVVEPVSDTGGTLGYPRRG
jgi:hypothetical protein